VTTATVGTALAAGAFLSLLSAFTKRTSVWASKVKAERKLKSLEDKEHAEIREAIRSMQKLNTARDVEWDVEVDTSGNVRTI
jgi:hypothetical protein